MQQLDYRTLPNSSGWFVKLNPETLLFEIVCLGNKRSLNRVFTNRKLAELHLYRYLWKATNPNPVGRQKGSTNKPKTITEEAQSNT